VFELDIQDGLYMRIGFQTLLQCVTAFLALTLLSLAQPAAREKGGLDATGPYRVVENWFKPGVEQWNQPVTGVAVDNPNRIFVVSSGQQITQPGSLILGPDGVTLNPVRNFSAPPIQKPTHEHLILVLDADGKVVEDWSQWNNDVVLPHSVELNPYDPERHVWVVDRDGDQILKFTNDGKKLVLRLGEKGVPGSDHSHFNWPASLLFMPDGSFYVADGYHNTRVVKFDKSGKYLTEWGAKGNGPGQFNLIHDIAIDARNAVSTLPTAATIGSRSSAKMGRFSTNGGTFIIRAIFGSRKTDICGSSPGMVIAWPSSISAASSLLTGACMAGLLGGSMIRIQLMSTLWAIFMSRKSGTTASRNLFPAKMPTSRVSSDRSSSLKVALIRRTGLARCKPATHPNCLVLPFRLELIRLAG
jgi:6-bladed beta-propeller